MQDKTKKNITYLAGFLGGVYVLQYTSVGRRIKSKVRKVFSSEKK